jgi:ATP-dependent Lon protease
VTKLYPLMPLRDIVIFPHMVAPLVVGRKKSIQALEDAMEKKTDILLVTQQKATVDNPESDDLYNYGTLAAVMQLLRPPDGTIKALVEGKTRAKIISYVPHDNFLQAEVDERIDNTDPTAELVAYERELRTIFEQFALSNKKIAKEVLNSVKSIDNPLKLLNVVCSHLPLKSDEKQSIL